MSYTIKSTWIKYEFEISPSSNIRIRIDDQLYEATYLRCVRYYWNEKIKKCHIIIVDDSPRHFQPITYDIYSGEEKELSEQLLKIILCCEKITK